jgi:predicted lipoprotein with Yx(FWY)xxD motif
MRSWLSAALAALVIIAAPASATLPADVQIMRSDAGAVLLDARGRVLYTYARDTQPDVSTCVAECAKAWPPLAVRDSAPQPVADWSAITRPDGSRQWAFRGKPLYTYAKDDAPRVALGDRVGQAWRVARIPLRTPPGVAVRSIHLGRALVDARGLTLYWSDDRAAAGRQGRGARTSACAAGSRWPHRCWPIRSATGSRSTARTVRANGPTRGGRSICTCATCVPATRWATTRTTSHGRPRCSKPPHRCPNG